MTQQAQTETKLAGGSGALESIFPFLPRMYSCQSVLPALVAAEQELLGVIAGYDSALGPDQKLRLMHIVTRGQVEQAASSLSPLLVGSTLDPVLEAFALKLSLCPAYLSADDIKPLTESGGSASTFVETVCAVAIAQFVITLAKA